MEKIDIPILEVTDRGDEMGRQAQSHCAHILYSDGLLEYSEELFEFGFIVWISRVGSDRGAAGCWIQVE